MYVLCGMTTYDAMLFGCRGVAPSSLSSDDSEEPAPSRAGRQEWGAELEPHFPQLRERRHSWVGQRWRIVKTRFRFDTGFTANRGASDFTHSVVTHSDRRETPLMWQRTVRLSVNL
jgi:hypothetical protein